MSSGRPEGPDPDGIGKKWREQARESVCDDILAVRDFREIGAQKYPLLTLGWVDGNVFDFINFDGNTNEPSKWMQL